MSSWGHLDNVWGVGGALRPVKVITKQMAMLLKEYLLSRDAEEAQRCILALEVPHFHHELIYEVSHFGQIIEAIYLKLPTHILANFTGNRLDT
jgi:hypothetical protein